MEPADIDLGEFASGEPKVVTVRVVNDSSASIFLAAVVPTCGCTVAAWAGQSIAPHGSLAVEITAKPGNEPGRPFARGCTFHVEGAPPATCTLRGRVSGPAHPLRCEPPVLDLGEIAPEEKAVGAVRLVNTSSRPMRILRAVPPCSCAMPALDRLIEPGRVIEVPVHLWAGSRQGAILSKRWTFQIEGQPPLVYEVRGRVAEHIAVVPEVLSADAAAPDSGRLTLGSLDGSAFRVLDAMPPIVSPLDGPARVEHELQVDWDKWAALGGSAKVRLAVDHERMNFVSVMIRRNGQR